MRSLSIPHSCYCLLKVNEVSHAGLVADTTAEPFLDLAIGPSYTIMLTKMFCPRTDDECFDVAVWNFEVSTDSPS